jgi:hypothetical protein
MGILDDARDLLSEHQDTVADGIEKARDLAKEKAPGTLQASPRRQPVPRGGRGRDR